MFEKKRVLILMDWFTPGYKGGGPIRSVTNLIKALSSEIEFSIVTRNTDAADAADPNPQPYENVTSDVWTRLTDETRIYYFSQKRLNFQTMSRVIATEKFDFLYINSLFSPRFTILPLLIVLPKRNRDYEIVVAPRGSLQAGALSQKKVKKQIFLEIFNRLKLAKQIIWQATDRQESDDIKAHFGNDLRIRFAPNLPDQAQTDWMRQKKTSGEARFIFASRVSPKKNLDFFLERLKTARGSIVFDIYGPPQDLAYVRRCEKLIEQLPANVSAKFKGSAAPAQLNRIMRDYHFSVLTTRGENFGHSIFESFVHGKPILTSDKTPWRNLEKQRLGWDISLDDAPKFESAIQHCVEMSQDEYDLWSQAAWNFAAEYRQAPELIEQSRRLFA